MYTTHRKRKASSIKTDQHGSGRHGQAPGSPADMHWPANSQLCTQSSGPWVVERQSVRVISPHLWVGGETTLKSSFEFSLNLKSKLSALEAVTFYNSGHTHIPTKMMSSNIFYSILSHFILLAYLLDCARSWLQHGGPSTFIEPCRMFSFSTWDPVPRPGIEPRPPALGAQSLSHWTTREVAYPLLFKF